MYDLLRFVGTKERAEMFRSGSIYMSSIGYFWKNGFGGQQDYNEGIVKTVSPNNTFFPTTPANVITGAVRYRLESFKFCNTASFVLHKFDGYRKIVQTIHPMMREFGEYVVRIKDTDTFVYRLIKAAHKKNDYLMCGPVFYYDRDYIAPSVDCFNKLDGFEFQQEWRIMCLHDYKKKKLDALDNINSDFTEPYVLNIGDISDIVSVYTADEFYDCIHSIYPKCKVVGDFSDAEIPEDIYDKLRRAQIPIIGESAWINSGIPRWFFNKLVYDLDGGHYKVAFTI